MNTCIREYFRRKIPGLYEALCLIAGADFSEVFEKNKREALRVLSKLYGEAFADLLLKSIMEECFKNKHS